MGNRLIVTDDEPIEEGRLWLVNGSEFDVDFYLNYDPVAYVQGIEARSIGAVFRLKDSENRPYGEYTLEAREADKPNSPVLASASAQLAEKKGFEAVFYEKAPGEYEMAIFENDYSGCEDPRMEIRHGALQQEISWRLRPSGENPEITPDTRMGSLEQGQYQVVEDITENDYFFEVFVDGELSTFYVDLDSPPELNKYFTVHVLGDLPTFGVTSIEEYDETYIKPASVEPPVPVGTEGNWMQMHEIEVPVAPGVPDSISMPMDAYAQVDDNQPTEFMVESVVGYETNNVETTVRASDADGIVTDFLVDSVEPKYDGFEFLDNTFDRATTIGGTSSQVLRTLADVPVGSYELTLVANRESLNADFDAVDEADYDALVIPGGRAPAHDLRGRRPEAVDLPVPRSRGRAVHAHARRGAGRAGTGAAAPDAQFPLARRDRRLGQPRAGSGVSAPGERRRRRRPLRAVRDGTGGRRKRRDDRAPRRHRRGRCARRRRRRGAGRTSRRGTGSPAPHRRGLGAAGPGGKPPRGRSRPA